MTFQTPVEKQSDLKRFVFTTTVQTSDHSGTWVDFGSLEVGMGMTLGGQLLSIIIYRSRLNQITDLTTYVDVTVTDDSSFSLSLPLEKASDPDIAPGFTITVVGWGAKPKFTGILGPSVTSSSAQLWQGQYLIVDGAPLSSLLSPPVPISADVQAFLSLSPLTTTSGADVDKAKQWGIDILQDIMLHTVSSEGQSDFFKNLGPLGSFFAIKDLPGGSLPSGSPLAPIPLPPATNPEPFYTGPGLLTGASESPMPLMLSSIQSANFTLFEYLGVHVICHALKTAKWLDPVYADHIKDLAAEFVAMLVCSDAELNDKEQAYGLDMPLIVQNQVGSLRTQYFDAATRCYLAGWATLCPNVAAFDSATALVMYNAIVEVVSTDSYKARSIEVEAGAPSAEAATTISTQLGMLHDKLVLLQLLSGTVIGTPEWITANGQINSVISGLETGATATGLFGQTNVAMQAEDFKLQPTLDDIFSGQELNDKWTRDNVSVHDDGRVPNAASNFDYRTAAADQYLLASAKSLGLYTEPSISEQDPSHCVIL